MSRKAKRERAKARRRDRLAQSKADAESREDWFDAIHGEREDLELLAGDDSSGRQAREAVLRSEEVPDGVTHAMLRAACNRALT